MTEQPTTAAGRALLQSFREMAEHQAAGRPFIKPPSAFVDSGRDSILAIEAEARQQDGSALRHEPHRGKHTDYGCGFSGPHCWACNEPWPCRTSRGAALPPTPDSLPFGSDRMQGEVMRMPPRLLRSEWPPNEGLMPGNPRFDEMLASVQANGIQEPLTINLDWRVIDGQHRLAAARLLGLESVPVRVWTGTEYVGMTSALAALPPSAPAALDVERLARAEHFWCVQVEGEWALGHEWTAHEKQAAYILARLQEPER